MFVELKLRGSSFDPLPYYSRTIVCVYSPNGLKQSLQ